MADRPQVNGWTAINLNKPEEYSSEFLVDGNRYANVTNVSTGQRQLYLVSGLGGTPLTQRSLLTTTNADGTVTKGEAYNSFINTYGKDKLTNAEINNKRQSAALLANNKVSTQSELDLIKESKEFKSTGVGKKPPQATGDATGASFDAEKFGQSAGGKAKTGTRDNFKQIGPLIYPTDIGATKQDIIKFDMIKYKPKKFSSDQFGFSARERAFSKDSIGTVILPIPSGISDTNSCNWGGADMNALKAGLADIALTTIKEGGEEGADKTAEVLDRIKTYAGDAGTAVAAAMAEDASGAAGLLTRTTGSVINPNLELLFQSPALRTFGFTFKMSARNQREAKTIIAILRFFKQGMAAQRSESNLFLKTPHTFGIRYMHRASGKEEEHKYIGKIKECALTSLTVNYTPEGQYATFWDGPMVSYEMQMQFQELEPIFNDDYVGVYEDIGF